MRATQRHRQTDGHGDSQRRDDRPAERKPANVESSLDVASRGTQTHSDMGGRVEAMWSARRYTSVSTRVDESSK